MRIYNRHVSGEGSMTQASDGKYQVNPPDNSYGRRLQKIVAELHQRDVYAFNFKVYLTKDIDVFAMADGLKLLVPNHGG